MIYLIDEAQLSLDAKVNIGARLFVIMNLMYWRNAFSRLTEQRVEKGLALVGKQL